MKVNEGEVPQYYVTGSHPPIISTELFDHVQLEFQRSKGVHYVTSGGCFAGRIICGDCGSVYGSKLWHSNDKYRRTVWQCNGKFKGDQKCSTPHFREEMLKEMFVAVMNRCITDKIAIISAYREIIRTLTDNAALEKESVSIRSESDVVMELMRKMVQENTRTVGDQMEYQHRYSALVERYEKAESRLAEVNNTITTRNTKRLELERFMRVLKKQENLLTEFDEEIWFAVVDKLVVRSADDVTFAFKDGSELPWIRK